MRKVGLIFPGQGSQFIGMGKELYDEFKEAEGTFEEANDCLGYDLKKICFEGRVSKLNQPAILFPAILTVSIASYRSFAARIDAEITAALGHSLGEFSALCSSGVLRFADALKLVEFRGKLIEEDKEAGSGNMAIVQGMSERKLEAMCSGNVAISCFNAPKQYSISGDSERIDEIGNEILQEGKRITPLITSPPMHCGMLKQVAERFEKELEKFHYEKGNFPVLSCYSALPYEDNKESVVSNLSKQLVYPVQWIRGLEYMEDMGVDSLIEMGSNSVVTNLVRMNQSYIQSYPFFNKQTAEEVYKQFQDLHESKIIEGCLRIATTTPSQSGSKEKSNLIYEAYKKIDELQKAIDEGHMTPNEENIIEAIEWLKVILTQKGIEEKVQREWIHELKDFPLRVKLFGV